MTLEPHPAGAVYRNGLGQNKESADAEGEGKRIPRVGVEWDDKMETFFLVRSILNYIGIPRDTNTLMRRVQSETLKYLYLLFSDDSVLPFDSKLPPI